MERVKSDSDCGSAAINNMSVLLKAPSSTATNKGTRAIHHQARLAQPFHDL